MRGLRLFPDIRMENGGGEVMKKPVQKCVHDRALSRIIRHLKFAFAVVRQFQARGKPLAGARALKESCLKAAAAAEKVKP